MDLMNFSKIDAVYQFWKIYFCAFSLQSLLWVCNHNRALNWRFYFQIIMILDYIYFDEHGSEFFFLTCTSHLSSYNFKS